MDKKIRTEPNVDQLKLMPLKETILVTQITLRLYEKTQQYELQALHAARLRQITKWTINKLIPFLSFIET